MLLLLLQLGSAGPLQGRPPRGTHSLETFRLSQPPLTSVQLGVRATHVFSSQQLELTCLLATKYVPYAAQKGGAASQRTVELWVGPAGSGRMPSARQPSPEPLPACAAAPVKARSSTQSRTSMYTSGTIAPRFRGSMGPPRRPTPTKANSSSAEAPKSASSLRQARRVGAGGQHWRHRCRLQGQWERPALPLTCSWRA